MNYSDYDVWDNVTMNSTLPFDLETVSMDNDSSQLIENITPPTGTDFPTEYYYYYYEATTVESDYLQLLILDFEPAVLGILRPLLVFLTLVANVFVLAYFLTRKSRRKASNLLFMSIAVSDSLTGIALLPNSLYVFAAERTRVSEETCDMYMVLRLYVTQVFHTVSVWQTLMLGIQRYMCVCHPFISSRVCTFWKTVCSIVVMYVCAIVLHIHHLLRPLSNPPDCVYVYETPCHGTCIYMWFRAILQHLLPSLLLVVLTIKTISTLRKAHRRASTIISNKTSKSNRTNKERVISITAALIVTFFLIPEVPYGIYQVALIFHINGAVDAFLTIEFNHIAFCVYEILLVVCFNANFWIYCVMMHDFRQFLLAVVSCGVLKKRKTRSRAISSSSFRKDRNNSLASRSRMLSRTTSIHSTTSDNANSIRLTPLPSLSTERSKLDFPILNNNVDLKDDDVFV